MLRRPARALPSVTSSACSRSAPTGRPLARRVTEMCRAAQPFGDVERGRLAGRRRVGGEDDLGDVAAPGPDGAARRFSGPRRRSRRSARAPRRARGRARGIRGCARSGSRRRAPRPRRSSSGRRFGSAQIRQSGPSARLKHCSQSPTFSFTSRIASPSAKASSSGARNRWKASRCAVRWPIPGRRESSATRRASGAGPSVLTRGPRSRGARSTAEHPAEAAAAQPAGHVAHFRTRPGPAPRADPR